MKYLIGYTGFVGSNLMKTMKFDAIFNSKNVKKAYSKKPDVLVYAGIRGTKFLANKFPYEDKKNIEEAIFNLKEIKPKKLILISTVDVYDNLENKDEDYHINPENLNSYGRNRYFLERWVINNVEDYHILRLPAIYGINLKKNFIHDLINPCPEVILKKDFTDIEKEYPNLEKYYKSKGNIYIRDKIDEKLIHFFHNTKYNAIYFTDSNSRYQYLNLDNLHLIIDEVIKQNIKILNCVTEQIESSTLYDKIFQKQFYNILSENPINYNLKTKYKLKGFNYQMDNFQYLLDKKTVLENLVEFIKKRRTE